MDALHRRHRRRRTGAWIALGTAALLASLAVADRPPAGAATEIRESDRAAIRRVIEEQISAFKRDDASSAFSYAAPAIQSLFGTPERFLLMVMQNYAPIYRPRVVSFGELELVAGEFTQKAVIGEEGTAAVAYYLMTRQPDGSWRIARCILAPQEKREA